MALLGPTSELKNSQVDLLLSLPRAHHGSACVGNIHEFCVPQNEALHTALHTDFAKGKHSPVNITRTQLSNFYV